MMKELFVRMRNTVKYTLYFPFLIPTIFFYVLIPGNRKKVLLADLDAFYKNEFKCKRLSNITAFYRLMIDHPAFRNVFYYRLWSRLFHLKSTSDIDPATD
ncbi:MAG: hypothetical protein NC043_06500, partial [Muribaculaceae bacterium]|nr:hypothetical protein [Muribaculaceae bacterium]